MKAINTEHNTIRHFSQIQFQPSFISKGFNYNSNGFQGLSQGRCLQDYYDNIDKRDPRSMVAIPGVEVDDHDISRFGSVILAFISIILVLVTLPFSLCYCVKVVQEYERAVIFRLGRLKKGRASGPGLFFILPCIDKYSCVDLRTVSYEVPPQEMLSRDSVTVSVDAVCFYKVTSEHGF